MRTCLHRMIGECKNCLENYSPQNRPNNTDCKRYYEVNLQTVRVIGDNLEIKSIGKRLDKL
jgi:hypothetical protein